MSEHEDEQEQGRQEARRQEGDQGVRNTEVPPPAADDEETEESV